MKLQLDPHPFARGGSVAIVTVSGVHIIQAGLLLHSHLTGNATCLLALLMAMRSLGVQGDGPVLAITMVATALLAVAGAVLRIGWIRLLIFIPQHIMLGVMAVGGLWAAWQGAYLDGTRKYFDGTVLPWDHILADQLIITAVFVIHTSAIIRRAWDPNG